MIQRTLPIFVALALATSCGGSTTTTSNSATSSASVSTTDAPPAPAPSTGNQPTAATQPATTTVAPASADPGTSCHGLKWADVAGVIGDEIAVQGPNLFPATAGKVSDSCFVSASQSKTSTIERKMSIDMTIEVFDPARHVIGGKPATYDLLRANNEACCNVADVPGIADAAFRWINRDTARFRGVATVFRKGDLGGAVYIRFSTADSLPLDDWTNVEAVLLRATEAVASKLAGLPLASNAPASGAATTAAVATTRPVATTAVATTAP